VKEKKIIDHFTSQPHKELLIAAAWRLKNYEFTAKLMKQFWERKKESSS